jgi:hypothetical protein
MPASGVVALVLAPDLTRGPGEGVSLAVPASASVVRITLQHEGESHASYRVVIRTPEDAEVWSASAVKPVKGGQSAVVVDVPASRLSPNNDYVVALSALAPDGASEALADYSFRVVRESSRAIRR